MANNDVFAVIADKTRRGILTALKDGERPVGELVAELGVAQPTVSKHLKILREAGMVSMEARGQRRLYAVRAEPLSEVTDWLDEVVAGADHEPGAGAARRSAPPAGTSDAETSAAPTDTAPTDTVAADVVSATPTPTSADTAEADTVAADVVSATPTRTPTSADTVPADTVSATPASTDTVPATLTQTSPAPTDTPTATAAPRPGLTGPELPAAGRPPAPGTGARAGGLFSGLAGLRRRTRKPRR